MDESTQLDTAEAVQRMIEAELDKRTVFLLSRMYFGVDPNDDKLVTIGHVKRMLMVEGKMTHDIQLRMQERITALTHRVAQLERPWWQRWLSR